MKLQIASDLHHQFSGAGLATSRALAVSPEADVLVLAGNIHSGEQAVSTYQQSKVPVIWVHGNHELHGSDVDEAREGFASTAVAGPVKYLERTEFSLGDIRFLGCCLWTDYSVGPQSREVTMREANRFMVDHRLIRKGSRPFKAEDAAYEHLNSLSWLKGALQKRVKGRTVVVTHFAPSKRSIPQALHSEVFAGTFASSLVSRVRNSLPYLRCVY